MKKINILILIIIVLLTAFFIMYKKDKLYEQNLFYMDTYINVKFFTSDSNKATEALEEINLIYKKYHELSDRYQAYHGVNNVYYINNTNDKEVKVDKELYDLISYGKEWYYKSNGIKNINLGNVIDIWRSYKDNNLGVPIYEILAKENTDIENIVLLDDNIISINENVNLDLGSVSKGYATEKVGEYLESININKYLVNAGGNVLVGDHYSNSTYKIGIQNPVDGVGIYQVVNAVNKAVVTSGGYERYYTFEGMDYNHIIDPNTLFPANKYKSVTVITSDSAIADGISLVLYVLDIEDGKEFLKQFSDVEAIWFIDEDNIVKTDGFNKYE